jgi:outer membrane protein OmpA-like peptidoglycan-associated protein
MTHRHIIAGSALATLAVLAGCQQPDGATDQAAAANASKTAFGAPAPSPSPTATPSARSIMQPDVIEQPILPPPPMPVDATIGFPDGGARLDDAATRALDAVLANPVTATGGAIVLRGSSDSHGSDADNKAASKARAEAAARYLEKQGVAKDRITVIALGEDRPVAPNANPDGSDNPAGRARNRRVDITVKPGEQPVPAPAPTPSPSPTPSPGG